MLWRTWQPSISLWYPVGQWHGRCSPEYSVQLETQIFIYYWWHVFRFNVIGRERSLVSAIRGPTLQSQRGGQWANDLYSPTDHDASILSCQIDPIALFMSCYPMSNAYIVFDLSPLSLRIFVRYWFKSLFGSSFMNSRIVDYFWNSNVVFLM